MDRSVGLTVAVGRGRRLGPLAGGSVKWPMSVELQFRDFYYSYLRTGLGDVDVRAIGKYFHLNIDIAESCI